VSGGANANTSALTVHVSTPVFNVVSGGGSVAIDGNTSQSNYAFMPHSRSGSWLLTRATSAGISL